MTYSITQVHHPEIIGTIESKHSSKLSLRGIIMKPVVRKMDRKR